MRTGQGLDNTKLTRSGYDMVHMKGTMPGQTIELEAQIQAIRCSNEIKVGYSPIGHMRCGRSARCLVELTWKMAKETCIKKMVVQHSSKSDEMAQCSLARLQPFVADMSEKAVANTIEISGAQEDGDYAPPSGEFTGILNQREASPKESTDAETAAVQSFTGLKNAKAELETLRAQIEEEMLRAGGTGEANALATHSWLTQGERT